MTYISRDDLKQWAMSRETSNEVALAIFAIAADNQDADRIWSSPTDVEFARVAELAWGYADGDTEKLCWGCETLERS